FFTLLLSFGQHRSLLHLNRLESSFLRWSNRLHRMESTRHRHNLLAQKIIGEDLHPLKPQLLRISSLWRVSRPENPVPHAQRDAEVPVDRTGVGVCVVPDVHLR